jgi:hypothetical protein
MYKKYILSDIQLDKLGTARMVRNCNGDIHLVRVEYGENNPGTETSIEITTSEGETLKYATNNKDFLDYPRHSVNTSQFLIFTGGESVDTVSAKYGMTINSGTITPGGATLITFRRPIFFGGGI